MTDPSDPIGTQPVNRLKSVSPSLEELVSHALGNVWADKREIAADQEARFVASLLLEDSPASWKQLDRREMYRAVYALVRTEIALGEETEAIRTGFGELAAELGAMAETIASAVEDALAGRRPRW